MLGRGAIKTLFFLHTYNWKRKCIRSLRSSAWFFFLKRKLSLYVYVMLRVWTQKFFLNTIVAAHSTRYIFSGWYMGSFITVIITLPRKFQCSDGRKLIQFTSHVTLHRYLIIWAVEMDNMRLHQLFQLPARNEKKKKKKWEYLIREIISKTRKRKHICSTFMYILMGKIDSYFKFISSIKFEFHCKTSLCALFSIISFPISSIFVQQNS